jgi:hypothetical protein
MAKGMFEKETNSLKFIFFLTSLTQMVFMNGNKYMLGHININIYIKYIPPLPRPPIGRVPGVCS